MFLVSSLSWLTSYISFTNRILFRLSIFRQSDNTEIVSFTNHTAFMLRILKESQNIQATYISTNTKKKNSTYLSTITQYSGYISLQKNHRIFRLHIFQQSQRKCYVSLTITQHSDYVLKNHRIFRLHILQQSQRKCYVSLTITQHSDYVLKSHRIFRLHILQQSQRKCYVSFNNHTAFGLLKNVQQS